MSLIELRNVKKIYNPGENEVVALNNINLKIEKGELLSIQGTSGSGKSTMLNTLGLLDRPTSGEHLLDGQNVESLNDNELSEARNLKIGFVFQQFFLIPKLTAAQNVMLPLLYRNVNTGDALKKARALLDKFGIGKYYRHRPNQLSGGQQQRVALARALVGEPQVILADEPTGALDSRTSQSVIDALHQLHDEEQKTIIIVTHDPHVGDQCERVVELQDGQIVNERKNTEESMKKARATYNDGTAKDEPKESS